MSDKDIDEASEKKGTQLDFLFLSLIEVSGGNVNL